MGLASALSTALTGLTAAETQIDVVGNNLANSQTVGFKASEAVFATQFLQTQGLGSAPTSDSGGTNPRQVGLGTQVAEITPDFTQGTIEVSNSPSDLAIQGDGFFIVEGAGGETLYSRNGIFKTNSANELVNTSGNRLLGYGVDEFFSIQTTSLVPITIPLGSAAVAQATDNVFLEGIFSPSGEVADTGEVIESFTFGDGSIPRPDSSGVTVGASSPPSIVGLTAASADAGGSLTPGDIYQYRFVYVNEEADGSRTEGVPSQTLAAPAVAAGENAISLSAVPNAKGGYDRVAVYRTEPGGSTFYYQQTVDADGNPYVDDGSVAVDTNQPLDTSVLSGNYTYMITYGATGLEESRPSAVLGGGPLNIVQGRVHIQDMPSPPAGPPVYDQVNIYRNLADDPNRFFKVTTLNAGESFTDNRTDAAISDLSDPAASGNKLLDFDGPKADSNTLLTDLIRYDGTQYSDVFDQGSLTYQGRKGGRALSEKDFTIGADTTLQELVDFVEDASGIQIPLDDPQHPIPNSDNTIVGETGELVPGGTVSGGKVRFVSNNGTDNALDIGLSAFTLTSASGDISTPNLGFGTVQEAVGESAVTDFIVYDSLGIPLNVRVTTVLETSNDNTTVYRWFADSPDNDPRTGSDISVGTGQLTFDGKGNYVGSTNTRVSIERRNVPSASPLEFELDFSEISSLATNESTLAASRQDGSAAGVLNSFIIGEDGVVRGVFSNGVARSLGQIRLASFANPTGLNQRGQNLFAAGVNSGLPIEGNPGQDSMGSVIAGAVELSNTDIGGNLIDLILASTQYRGNTRVINTSQQLFDELLNLRR